MITNARNKSSDNKFFDQNLDDVLKRLHKEAFILETFEAKKSAYQYPQSNYYNIGLLRRILQRFYKRDDYTSLLNLINTTFGSCPGLDNQYLNNLINGFKFDYGFYKRIIKRKQVKAIFITQNGIQKGLFAAGRDLGVPVIEYQHGLIERAHIAYSYNERISYPALSICLPAYFFSFSEYWTKLLFYPVGTIMPIGNTSFYKSLLMQAVEGKQPEGLTVVSANIYGEQLKEFILAFLKLDNHTMVYFKLHPNQWNEAAFYAAAFESFDTVSVITNEMSMGQLVQQTKATLVIKSTAIYEALQAQRTGIVYNVEGAMTPDDAEGLVNLHFVSDAMQLKQILDDNVVTEKYEEGFFFKNFDAAMFSDFMEKNNI
ncbi:MAG: hypothetical protein J7623_24005 [Chitinophaga sp.]|uniref:hypothetical protein n=1 Tax=Chitinophaga sp. TaxID=1869181 RepID=UPI001B28AF33|nr:hypothetical protein [Chitinophaga sp.]MBO9731726.1 hypothetical protein [Chitinophaga sp.]